MGEKREMLSHGKEILTVVVVVAVVTSGLAGVAIGGETAKTTTHASAQEGGGETELACAATPPDNLSDPDEDVIGWENGTWYSESIDVDQSDGVQDDELDAIVARTMARVEAVRCIEFNESVPVSTISREEFRQSQLEREVSDELQAFDNAKFEALFLVNQSTDSLEVQNENRGTGILGFYSPRSGEIVLVAESTEQLRIEEVTLAHELVHAWQDQQFNLTSGELEPVRLRDEGNARDGLVEGDASLVDTLYDRQCGQAWNCLEGESGSSGELANIGVYAVKFLPYSDGPVLVQSVKREGGWEAVNDLYENPPASTEQIIHPEKYESDPPTNVSLEDTATGEWERVRPPNRPDYASMGEAALMSMFVYPLYDSQGRTQIVSPDQWLNRTESGNISEFDPFNYTSPYSAGWDGDRLHVYQNGSGELAYVWKLAWDSEQDAEEFVEGYQLVLQYWGGEQVGPNTWRIDEGGFADAFYVEVDGANVTIVNAPTVGQLTEVRSGIDVAATDGEGTTDETTTTNETTTANETTIDETTTNETATANETA
jgi:hypothetical protein